MTTKHRKTESYYQRQINGSVATRAAHAQILAALEAITPEGEIGADVIADAIRRAKRDLQEFDIDRGAIAAEIVADNYSLDSFTWTAR